MWFIGIAILLMASCNGGKNKKKETLFDFDSPTQYSDENISSGNQVPKSLQIVEIPFRERNGVKTIPVKINDAIEVDMIFDTGASNTLISAAEAGYLYSKGLLTEADFQGLSQSQIADGSIVENMVITLRKITIASRINAYDITAIVSKNTAAPLLLGNEVLDRMYSYTIDNKNKVIKFELK